MLRFLTAGESHGKELTVIIEGLPAGLELSGEEVNRLLHRRQGGYGRGARQRIETDIAEFTAGLRGGLTTGAPFSIRVMNRDWENWRGIMDSSPLADLGARVLTRPRPGHADLAGGIKYHQRDMRNILERSSARETAARVAAGAVAEQLLGALDITMASHVTQVGLAAVKREITLQEALERAPLSQVYCADAEIELAMIAAIDKAKQRGDSLGGVFEVLAANLPVGLGSHVQWDRRLDGRLAQALMSIQAIKGVEVGLGFRGAAMPGSQVHDPIAWTKERGFYRERNGAGGLEGGMTNGETLVLRAAMKPIPTLMKPLESVDINTKVSGVAAVERSDACAVPAASIVGQAAVALVLADALLEKFGGDHIQELQERTASYRIYSRDF